MVMMWLLVIAYNRRLLNDANNHHTAGHKRPQFADAITLVAETPVK